MHDSITLRPRFGKALTILVAAIVLAAFISTVISGDWLSVLKYGAPLLLAVFVAWVLFWSPAVILDPASVSLRNLVRTRRISWPAIERIDTKYALTLYTAQGKYTAWAAPAPGRMATVRAGKLDLKNLPESTYGPGNSIALGDIPTSESGLASLHVRRIWEQLRDDGRLDSGAIEGTGVTTTIDVPIIIVFGFLALATVVSILL